LSRIVERWGKAVGVRPHPHLFRHTYATGLVASGVPLDAVQAWLGHADLASTAEYLHTAHSRGAREGLEAWSGTLETQGSIRARIEPEVDA
jgi:integrase